ncbi:MAG: SDR family NAD(P)-dependent oxidoreductase [Saprospirales bacterium]|nr:SDR family NAD(P)-dependent oxidoreductase [Saprospirales bacterium]
MNNAIIIGATSGIGRELALILAGNGYRVGITGRRAEKLKELKECNPEKFVISAFDCTRERNSEKLAELTKALGGLDLLVLSAGTGDINESLDFDIENNTNQLNVVAFTEIVDWAFRYFEKQGKGHLVGISSIAGIRGNRIAPAYNASKAYQLNYLEGLRYKAAKTGKPIFVTDIRPGFVDTDMAKGEGKFWVASKEKAALQIFGSIKKRKDVGYVTRRWRLVAMVLKWLPGWIYKKM